eukprot:gene21399-biopygen14689
MLRNRDCNAPGYAQTHTIPRPLVDEPPPHSINARLLHPPRRPATPFETCSVRHQPAHRVQHAFRASAERAGAVRGALPRRTTGCTAPRSGTAWPASARGARGSSAQSCARTCQCARSLAISLRRIAAAGSRRAAQARRTVATRSGTRPAVANRDMPQTCGTSAGVPSQNERLVGSSGSGSGSSGIVGPSAPTTAFFRKDRTPNYV